MPRRVRIQRENHVNPVSAEFLKVQEARINTAYAKRLRNDPRYSWFNPAHLFGLQELERHLLKLLYQHNCYPLIDKRILEIGCGSGYWLREFIKWGARPENIFGIDLLPHRVAEATSLSPRRMNIQQGNAAQLQYSDETFDLVLQSLVFTSVVDTRIKKLIASEMCRVLKPNGLILWYDYHMNNPRNPDVQGVKCREIYELFPRCRIELKRITLAPPLTHLLAPYSWFLCYLLGKIPWLCSHYIGVIRKENA